MTWINVALLACVATALGVGFYLVWFLAHPRSPEQQGLEPEPGARDGAPVDGDGAEPREGEPAGEPR